MTTDPRSSRMTCGKAGCDDTARVRIRVSTVLQHDQFIACELHATLFGAYIVQMLDLPMADDWHIGIESLGWNRRRNHDKEQAGKR